MGPIVDDSLSGNDEFRPAGCVTRPAQVFDVDIADPRGDGVELVKRVAPLGPGHVTRIVVHAQVFGPRQAEQAERGRPRVGPTDRFRFYNQEQVVAGGTGRSFGKPVNDLRGRVFAGKGRPVVFAGDRAVKSEDDQPRKAPVMGPLGSRG